MRWLAAALVVVASCGLVVSTIRIRKQRLPRPDSYLEALQDGHNTIVAVCEGASIGTVACRRCGQTWGFDGETAAEVLEQHQCDVDAAG